MDFNTVTQFELDLAKWWGSPYAVATDCCTHAIELCLRYTDTISATCPQHTYISVPFTFEKLGIQWSFRDYHWEDYYSITDQITDSAVYWQPGGYLGGLQCHLHLLPQSLPPDVVVVGGTRITSPDHLSDYPGGGT